MRGGITQAAFELFVPAGLRARCKLLAQLVELPT